MLGPRAPFLAGAVVLVGAALLAMRYHARFGAAFAKAPAKA
jgi:hypothetical protein